MLDTPWALTAVEAIMLPTKMMALTFTRMTRPRYSSSLSYPTELELR
jgi:hypothetical protein